MDKGKYLDERANYARQARILRFIVFLLAVAVVINGVFVYSVNVKERIIFVPLLPEGEFYVAGKDASDSYLNAMVGLALYYRLTYNPASVGNQFNGFLRIVSPGYYGEVFNELNVVKNEINEMKVSSVFYPEEFKIKRGERIVEVKGRLQQWASEKQILNEERKCVVKYVILHGKFMIERLKICKPNEECKL